jgi:hypothetical protein
MGRILIFTGAIMAITVGMLYADNVPMVERHIFLPEIAAEQKEDMPVVSTGLSPALEKEIQFTGVMITPKGKTAIISENVKNNKVKQKQTLKEGEQIKGMTVKEIGPNYVVMVSKENSVRLDLYKGVKTRPAPVPEPVNTLPNGPKPGNLADAQSPDTLHSDTQSPNANPEQGATVAPPKGSPFGGANSGMPMPENSAPGNAGPGTNPFVDLLKNNAERRSNPHAAPGGFPLSLPGINQ